MITINRGALVILTTATSVAWATHAAMLRVQRLTGMSTDELVTKKRDLRQEALHLRLQQQSGQLEQPSRLRLLRRDVARVETVLSQRKNQPTNGKK